MVLATLLHSPAQETRVLMRRGQGLKLRLQPTHPRRGLGLAVWGQPKGTGVLNSQTNLQLQDVLQTESRSPLLTQNSLKRLKCKTWYHKSPRREHRQNILWHRACQCFLGSVSQTVEIKAKINKWPPSQCTSFCIAKETINKTKRQLMDWEKIFDVTNKGLIFFLNTCNSITKKPSNPIKKGAADHSLHCCCWRPGIGRGRHYNQWCFSKKIYKTFTRAVAHSS